MSVCLRIGCVYSSLEVDVSFPASVLKMLIPSLHGLVNTTRYGSDKPNFIKKRIVMNMTRLNAFTLNFTSFFFLF